MRLDPGRWPAGLLVLLAALGLYTATASGRCDRVADEYEVYLQVESLWERGTLAIDQVEAPIFFGRVGRDGHRWAPYGPGVAFLALPHHAAARAVAAVAGVPRDGDEATLQTAWRPLVMAWTSLASALWAAVAVAATFRAATALGAPEPRALLVAGLLAVGTFLWPYATTFFSEAASAALVALAAAASLEGRRLAAAAWLWLLVMVKATNVFVAPALLLLAAWPAPGAAWGAGSAAIAAALRRAGPALLAVVVACVAHAEWNEWRFRRGPLELGYDWGEMLRPGEAPRAFLLAALPRGLAVLLLSPGKSLLLFAPPVGLALARLPAAAAALALPLLAYAAYLYPEGGYCFGPRHLLPAVPLLVLPLALGPAPRRAAVGLAVALGAPLAALGCAVSFLEDQAMGEAGRDQAYYVRHPAESAAVPPGRPLNVYRLDYAPQRTYPARLAAHLAGRGTGLPGDGLEALPLHLARWRRHGVGFPAWPGVIPPLAGVALLVLGAAGLRRRCSFHGAPGVARDVSCDASGGAADAAQGVTRPSPSAGELRRSGAEGIMPGRDPSEDNSP